MANEAGDPEARDAGGPRPREASDAGDGGAAPGLLIELELSSALLVAAVGGLCVAMFAVLRSSPGTVTRVGIGVVVAVALNPVVSRLVRRGMNRAVAVAVVATSLVLGFAAVLTLLAPQAISQARDFSDELPSTVQELYSWPVVGARLERADAATKVERWVEELPARLDDATLSSLTETVLGGALATVIVVVTALVVLLDGSSLVRRLGAMIDPGRRGSAQRIGQIVYRTFGSYFAGSLFVAVLNGLVVLTAGLVLGVPLAPLAGVWSALTNLIPQVGGFLGGSFFVLLALTKSPLTAVLAAAIFLGYQQLENNVIQPAVIGTAVNLTPPTTMLAALIGGAAAGVPGALVATPLLGAMKALYLESRGHPMPESNPSLLRRVRDRHRDPDRA
jgi:predicted PurR-regulated permease PerM